MTSVHSNVSGSFIWPNLKRKAFFMQGCYGTQFAKNMVHRQQKSTQEHNIDMRLEGKAGTIFFSETMRGKDIFVALPNG